MSEFVDFGDYGAHSFLPLGTFISAYSLQLGGPTSVTRESFSGVHIERQSVMLQYPHRNLATMLPVSVALRN
jgi:hypothetical protein